MATNYDNPEIEQEALSFELNQKILSFIRSNPENLSIISQMLGADNFLKTIKVERGQAPVVSLDVAGFIKDLKSKKILHDIKLPSKIVGLANTILPPDEGEIRTGSGTGIEKKNTIPRTRYLMEVLADLKLNYESNTGTNTPDMVRALSYTVFFVPEMQTLILVNDEEGNATFIIYDVDETEQNDRGYFIGLRKKQLRGLGPKKVVQINFDRPVEEWKQEISTFIISRPEKIPKKYEINRKREKAPDGWNHNFNLSKKIKIGRRLIQSAVNKYRDSNPEWFKEYDDIGGRLIEYYSPELIKIVTQELSSRESAPEGWKTNAGLADKLIIADKTASNAAAKFRDSNPEWFKDYKATSGKLVEHYSPELIKEITKKFNTKEKAPDGWMTNKGLAKILNRGAEIIKKQADQYRVSKPEWFKEYDDEINQLFEHYSPELVQKIIEKMGARESAPATWRHNYDLAKILNRSRETIKKIADQYRISNPEWFKEYENESDRLIEYYSPELVGEITKKFTTREKAPDGWITNKGLAKILNKDKDNIKKQADQYRISNPEWFKEYDDASNRPREHYHPDLLKIIINNN